MDGHQFDDLLRALSRSRRTLLGAALAAAVGVSELSVIDAKKKKKKKPCKKKCATGCCTSKYGKCIQPSQQTSTQCGTGGEICRSTNCGGAGSNAPPPAAAAVPVRAAWTTMTRTAASTGLPALPVVTTRSAHRRIAAARWGMTAWDLATAA